MSKRKKMRTPKSAVHDDLYSEMDLDIEDDDLSYDDYLDDEDEQYSTRSKRSRRSPDWRRVELVWEKQRLRSALADFDDYDFEFADYNTE